MSHPTRDIETEVQRHAAFVRGVALRLTMDEADADDVVQQTALAALEHRPEAGTGLRRWLGRVAANFALRMLRGDGRRRSRERLAARPDVACADPGERREVIERLTGALATLDEPFRTVVIMRFYDGLTPARIAARLGVPAATVRTRLKRGLDRLRGDLDHVYGGDRERWSHLVLPLILSDLVGVSTSAASTTAPSAVTGGGAAPTGLVQGAVLMSKKLMIAAGVVVIGVAVYVAHELDAWDTGPRLEQSGAATAEDETASARRASVTGHAAANDAPVEPTAGTAEETAPATGAVAVPQAGITGRCVDEDGRAVADADVRLQLHPSGNRLEDTTGTAVLRNARTDTNGRFRFEGCPTDVEAFVRARTETLADARVRRSLDAAGSFDLGDLVLRRGGAIEGRIVRAGSGVDRARIEAWRRESRAGSAGMILLSSIGRDPRRTATDARGAFSLRGLADGEWMVRVTAGEARPAVRTGLHVTNAEIVEGVEIELHDGLVLAGIVRDVAGKTVAGADVTLSAASIAIGAGDAGGFARGATTTDSAGRFHFGGLPPDPCNLTVVRAGYASASKLMVMPSEEEYAVELEETGIAWGRVRDARTGAAVAGCRVTAGSGMHGLAAADVLLGAAAAEYLGESDPAGLFAVTGATTRDVSLTIEAAGRPSCKVRTPRLDAGSRHEMTVVLGRERRIDGVVLDPAGKPVARARVTVRRGAPGSDVQATGGPGHEPNTWRRTVRIGAPPDAPGTPTPVREHETFTDVDGAFSIDRLASGSWSVVASCEGGLAPASARVELDDDAAATVELRLEPGGVVSGRVWERPGEPFEGVRVVLEAVAQDTDPAPGDAMRTVLAGAGGAFEITGLPPGDYRARIDEADIGRAVLLTNSTGGEPEGEDVVVEAGRTTRVELTAPPKGGVEGVVVENGRPVAGVRVRLVGSDNFSAFNADTVHTDGWGMFRFDRVEPGEWTLEVRAPMAPDSLERTVEVVAHRVVEATFELPTGVIRGRVADATGKGIEGIVVSASLEGGDSHRPPRGMAIAMMSPGGGPASVQTMTAGPPQVRTDSSGRYELRYVAPGAWSVEVEGHGIIRATRDAIEMKKDAVRSDVDFTVEHGATLEVRLRGTLPDPGLGLVNVTEDRENAEPRMQPTTGDPVTFAGLRPGRYVVSVGGVGPAADLATKKVTVRPGKATVELDLKP